MSGLSGLSGLLLLSLLTPAAPNWISPDCLEKLKNGEKCSRVDTETPSDPISLENVYCPGQEQCVDLARCKSECLKVADGNLFMDKELLSHLNQIHCGVGPKQAPYVCCPREEITEDIYCDGILKDMLADEQENPAEEETMEQEEEEEEDLVDRGTCGVRQVFSYHIAGGVDTNPGDWPWMARIIYSEVEDDQQLCGGTLVTRRHVVTAAHCVKETRPIKVRLGDSDRSTEYDCLNVEEGCTSQGKACFDDFECAPKHVDYAVKSIIIHEDYSLKTLGVPKYDVSVLRLSSDVTLTEHIQPVCLPHSDGRDRGPLAITGWGNTRAGAGPPRPADILQLLYVNEVPLPFCNDAWKAKVDEDLLPSHICVKGVKIGESSCKGDSGGPLLRNFDSSTDELWQLAGVVSFGTNNCGNTDLPLGFIRIDGEVNIWLRNIIGNNLPDYP